MLRAAFSELLAVLRPPARGPFLVPGAVAATPADAPLELGRGLGPPGRVLLEAVEQQGLEIRGKCPAQSRGRRLGLGMEVVAAHLDVASPSENVSACDHEIAD